MSLSLSSPGVHYVGYFSDWTNRFTILLENLTEGKLVWDRIRRSDKVGFEIVFNSASGVYVDYCEQNLCAFAPGATLIVMYM